MDRCNLCGSTDWAILEVVHSTRVVRCRCGLAFVTPQPPRATLEAAYPPEYYRPWAAQASRRERIWRARVRTVTSLSPPPGHLLDVGCGDGSFLQAAAERGWTATGTEFSSAGADIARARNVPVFVGELEAARFPAERFAVITCWHVIEHAADPRRLLREMNRLLAPDGLLVLATPNLDDRVFQWAYAVRRGRRPRLYASDAREVHLFFFSAETVRRLVVSEGFAHVRVGFDRGAAAVPVKRAVDLFAYGWFRLTGIHWGMGLEVTARKGRAGDTGVIPSVRSNPSRTGSRPSDHPDAGSPRTDDG